jgi:class 3 adenylate cyclase
LRREVIAGGEVERLDTGVDNGTRPGRMSVTILFVDDEPDLEALVLQKFRRQIRAGEVSFVFAHDGLDALQKIEANPDFDMVVSDINMPRMDGLSLLAKLQEADDKKSTIIVSAYGDMSNIRTAMNRGAFDFLTKPIDFADLEVTIDKTLRHVETLRDARRRQAEAERAHASLSRYFSPQLASRLAAACDGDGMEVHRREVAAIFTDVTGFTSLVETTAPEVLSLLLNEYVGGMTEIVFGHEGTVAKVMGDGIQILFNAPGDQPDYATRAVACAHDLDTWAMQFLDRWRAKGVNFGVTRIGVHAGPVLVGNFGGNRFFDYTAYGDTINTASRLEAANKALGTRICVSAAVAAGAEGFQGRPVGDLVLRGRSEPLRAYEPLLPAVFAEPTTAQYSEAFAKLEAGDATALPAFAALVGTHANDALASFHLKRLLNGAKGVRMQLE